MGDVGELVHRQLLGRVAGAADGRARVGGRGPEGDGRLVEEGKGEAVRRRGGVLDHQGDARGGRMADQGGDFVVDGLEPGDQVQRPRLHLARVVHGKVLGPHGLPVQVRARDDLRARGRRARRKRERGESGDDPLVHSACGGAGTDG